MSDLVIETKKLTKIYGEQTAVNSVNKPCSYERPFPSG